MRRRTKLHNAAANLSNISTKLRDQGMIEEAVMISEIAVQLAPDSGEIRVNLGHAYVDKGQIDEATAEYEKAMEIDPSLIYAYDGLAHAYNRKGLLDKAIEYYKKVVELDPESAIARENLAAAYMDKESYDEAIAEFIAARELDPTNMGIYNDLGICYKRKGLLTEAIGIYKLAILQDPNDPVYHENLARAYCLKGLSREAVKEYRAAIRLGGETASIYNSLGNIYAKTNSFDKALKEFRKAVKLDPNTSLFKDNFISIQAIIASQKNGVSNETWRKRKLKTTDERSQEVPIIKGQINKAENTIEKWFEELRGEVIGELDFIDKTTFAYLDSVSKSSGIRLIVSNIKEDVCLEKARKCSRTRPYLEIIRIPKVHKRWIGCRQNFFIDIGADLKTDALGKSTHTMRKLLAEDHKKEVEQFEKFWKVSDGELKSVYGNENISKELFFSSLQTNEKTIGNKRSIF